MATVYIETSVPSYYFETRQTEKATAWRAATREWWDAHRHGDQLQTLQVVIAELSQAPVVKGRKALQLLDGIPILPEPEGLAKVVEYYLEQRLMPVEGSEGDAYHLAMASMNSMDYLLTWNCRHLANANKVRHISVVKQRLGLHVPIVTTPLTLIPEDEG